MPFSFSVSCQHSFHLLVCTSHHTEFYQSHVCHGHHHCWDAMTALHTGQLLSSLPSLLPRVEAKYLYCSLKLQLLVCSDRPKQGPRVQSLSSSRLPSISTVSIKNLNLYENLGLHHSPKVVPQQVWTSNFSLLSPSQPSSYKPDLFFEACICTEVFMQLRSNLYPDYYKTSPNLHTN